jgi:hypothetical protein
MSGNADSTTSFKFEKLSHHNYTKWKKNIDSVLMEKGVFGYVNGDVKEMMETFIDTQEKDKDGNLIKKLYKETLDPAKLYEFKVGASKALGVIFQHCNSFYQNIVSQFTDPKDAYDALQKHFNSKGVVHKTAILRQLMRARVTNCGNSVGRYLQTMKSLAEEADAVNLTAIRELVPYMILIGLPSQFNTLIEVLEQDENLTLEKVEEAIERKLINGFKNLPADDREDNLNNTPAKANFGKRSRYNDHRIPNEHHKKVKFNNHNKTQHDTRERMHDSDNNDKITPLKYSSAFVASSNNLIILDSGASEHMTSESLIDSKPTNQPIIFGNKSSTRATKIGTWRVSKLFLPNTLHVPGLAANLVSIGRLLDQGLADRVVLTKQGGKIISNGKIVTYILRRNGLYELPEEAYTNFNSQDQRY